jgi:CheY-like chemotaxis protein
MTSKKRILIVEDIADCRDLLVLVLRRAGYEVDEAATGLAAIARAQAMRPDLIIMDLSLPGMTGDEATAHLKKHPFTRDIPVVVYTALHRQSPLVQQAITAGAVDILYKPVALKTFEEAVGRYVMNSDSDSVPHALAEVGVTSAVS